MLFFGAVDASRPTRGRVLEELRRELVALDLDLVVPSEPVFGAKRSELLNRSKTILNLRSNTWHPELVRFVLAAACGTAIVTDPPASFTEPFVEGEHFLMAEIPDLAEVLHELSRNEPRRAHIARNATELVTRDLTMTAVARRMLERTWPTS